MSESVHQRLAAIDREIAALRARRQALLQVAAAPWPKRLPLYAHINDAQTWDIGEQIQLDGDALRRFVHFDEVRLDVEVAEDGTVTILVCEGRAVTPWKPDQLLRLAQEALAETRSEAADDAQPLIRQALVVLEREETHTS